MISSFKTTIMALAALALASCASEEEGRIDVDYSAPAQVTNITATSAPGAVVLKWQNPTDHSFMYNKVEYTNARGESSYRLFSKELADAQGYMTATIDGFVKTSPVSFSIYSCAVKGDNKGAVEISGTPSDPNFVKLLDELQVEPSLGGVQVVYDNPYDESVVVGLAYHAVGDASKAGKAKFTIKPRSKGSEFVQLSYGAEGDFLSGEPCLIALHTEDSYENESQERQFAVTPQAIKVLDRSGWTVPGYNDSSSDATIGYSSQEANGEGATNGRVMCLFDGNTSTFWHARWQNPGSDYPHWFIVDLGADHTITSVALTGRINNAKEQTGQQIFVCADADAANKSNPDSWAWQDMGSSSFDPNNDNPQIIDLTQKLPRTRYIKVYFGTEHKGGGNYAMLSEMNVYAID